MKLREIMNQIPDDELLSAYLDGELTSEEQATVDRWLAESAEHRQLLEELRSLSQSLESLPRLQLEDDFYQSVLRRAEREMLSSKSSSTDGEKSPVDAMVGRAVNEAAAAKKSKGEPIAIRRESQDAAEDALRPAATGRRLPWPRGKRPWIYAGLAIAAALLVMLLSPQQLELQNAKLANNDQPNRHAQVGNADQPEAKDATQLDAMQRPDLASKAADHDRPAIEGQALERQTATESFRRKAGAVEQKTGEPNVGGGGFGGGGMRGLSTNLRREAGEADAKSGNLGDLAGGGVPKDRLDIAEGRGGNVNGLADNNFFNAQFGAGDLANSVAVIEVTLTPEALNSDVIRQCLTHQQILFEDAGTGLYGVANANRFNFPLSQSVEKASEPLSRTPLADAPAGKPSATSTSGGTSSGSQPADGVAKNGREKGDVAKANQNAVVAGAPPQPADNRALKELPEGLAAERTDLSLIRSPATDEVARIKVEAETEQIDGTLAYLHAHPEYFLKVDVRPAPTVEAQQGWSSYSRDLGEQVNEQVKKLSVQRQEKLQSFHDMDDRVGQKGQLDPKRGARPQSLEVQDKLADKQLEDKKAEKAAAAGSLAPEKPVADLQTADKPISDKRKQSLQEETAAKNRPMAKDEAPGPQPMPTSKAPLAKKPAATAPEGNGTVATQPAAPTAAVVGGAESKREVSQDARAERKAGNKEVDEKNLPQETAGIAKDETAYYYRTLGRARRFNIQLEPTAPTNPAPEAAPVLQQYGAAAISKSQPAEPATRVGNAKPGTLAPTDAPTALPPMPAAPTASATAAPTSALKSEIKTKTQPTDKSQPMPRAESPIVTYEKDQLAKPESSKSNSVKLSENQQRVPGADKGAGDAKGGKQVSEALHEKEAERRQQLRKTDPSGEKGPHHFQRAVIVIRVQQPLPVVTGPPATAVPPAAVPTAPAKP